MTTEADYSPTEWDLILGAPGFIALVITYAERCTPVETRRKQRAVIQAIDETAKQESQCELIQAVTSAVRRGRSPLWPAEHPHDAEEVQHWALDSCHQIALVLAQKAPEAEAQAYTRWLLRIAQRAAIVPPDDRLQDPFSEVRDELQRIALVALAIALDVTSAAEELRTLA